MCDIDDKIVSIKKTQETYASERLPVFLLELSLLYFSSLINCIFLIFISAKFDAPKLISIS